MAWVFLLIGVFICCVATGVIPAPEESFRAPWPIVFLTGMFFVCLGFFLFKPHDVMAIRLLVAGACGCLGTVALWCAVYGDGANFEVWSLPLDRSGGLDEERLEIGPHNQWAIRLSGSEALVWLARVVFFAGSGLVWLIAGAVLMRGFRKR